MEEHHAGHGATRRFRVSGELGIEYTMAELQLRAQNGEIDEYTEIAEMGSDEYKYASDYPELRAAIPKAEADSLPTEPRATPADAVARPPATRSIASHLLPAVTYPFRGIGWIIILIATALSPIPWVNLLGTAFSSVYGLAIGRASARGEERMPGFAELGSGVDAVVAALKLLVLYIAYGIFIGLVTMVFGLVTGGSWVTGLVFIGLYFVLVPAAKMILAGWKHLRTALTVSQPWNLVTTLGSDYFLAVGGGGGVVIIVFIVASFALPENLLPLALTVAGIWADFYIMHLLGRAVWLHRDELPELPS